MAHVMERATARGIAYDVRWRVKDDTGWRGRSFTATTEEEAILAKIAVERGEDPRRALPDLTTFETYWTATWEPRWSLGKAPKTVRTALSAKAALGPLMPLRLAALTRARVEDLVAEIARDSPRSAQLALSHAKSMLRDAAGRDHHVDRRIFEIPMPAYAEKEIRFLTWPEVERLAAFLDPRVHRIVPFAALTGMRKGELFGLTDRQVDVKAGSVTLRVTKTKKPRKVWLSKQAKKLLREQLLARTPNRAGYVFTTESGAQLGSRFEAAYRTAQEIRADRELDPILGAGRWLAACGRSGEELAAGYLEEKERVRAAEQVLLDGGVLDHGLDQQVCRDEVVDGAHAREHLVGVAAALLSQLLEALAHRREPALGRPRRRVVERDAAAAGGDDLRDAGAHLARAGDKDVLEAHTG